MQMCRCTDVQIKRRLNSGVFYLYWVFVYVTALYLGYYILIYFFTHITFNFVFVFDYTLSIFISFYYSSSFFVTKEVLEGKFYFLFGRKICLASLAQL